MLISDHFGLLVDFRPTAISCGRVIGHSQGETQPGMAVQTQPTFGKGQVVLYLPTGAPAEVIAVHNDDNPPYYTISIDGREKQTIASKLKSLYEDEPQSKVSYDTSIQATSTSAAWPCGLCTFINISSHLVCEMCGTRRA